MTYLAGCFATDEACHGVAPRSDTKPAPGTRPVHTIALVRQAVCAVHASSTGRSRALETPLQAYGHFMLDYEFTHG